VSIPGFSEPEHDNTNNVERAKKRVMIKTIQSVTASYHGLWGPIGHNGFDGTPGNCGSTFTIGH
jgi:hypothetical protein